MKITWLGHSCFRIEKNGFAVITDPYEDGSVPGLKPVRENAGLALCSHEHGDHNYRDAVTLSKAVPNPFTIESIDTWHDDVHGAKRGKNQIFILDDGESRIAHLGDLGCEPEPGQLERLKGLDAVLIPVGGFYTIDGKQAAELVKKIAPRIVIPMHYRSDAGKFGFDQIGTADDFIRHMDNVKTLPASEIETDMEAAAQVVVLQPANGKYI